MNTQSHTRNQACTVVLHHLRWPVQLHLVATTSIPNFSPLHIPHLFNVHHTCSPTPPVGTHSLENIKVSSISPITTLQFLGTLDSKQYKEWFCSNTYVLPVLPTHESRITVCAHRLVPRSGTLATVVTVGLPHLALASDEHVRSADLPFTITHNLPCLYMQFRILCSTAGTIRNMLVRRSIKFTIPLSVTTLPSLCAVVVPTPYLSLLAWHTYETTLYTFSVKRTANRPATAESTLRVL